jgi:Flp pilus assembly pilin Flp
MLGQGVAEYALILALVAAVVIGAALYLGNRVSATLSTVGTDISAPFGGGGPTPRATATPKPTKTPKPAKTPRPTKPPKPTKPPRP